jgi:putative endopeptidase
MRMILLAAVSAAALSTTAFAADPAQADVRRLGRRPDRRRQDGLAGADFDKYANGAWAARTEIPADQGSAGVGYDVYNRSQDQLRTLIETAEPRPRSARSTRASSTRPRSRRSTTSR